MADPAPPAKAPAPAAPPPAPAAPAAPPPEPVTSPPAPAAPLAPAVPPTPAVPPAAPRRAGRPPPLTVYRWGLFAGLGLLTVVLASLAVYAARTVLIQVVVAMFFAVSLDPAVRYLEHHGVRRGWAVTLIFVLALAVVVLFLVSVIPPLVTQFQSLLADLPGYVNELSQRFRGFRILNQRLDLTQQVRNLASTLPGRLGSGLLGFSGRVFGALFSGLTVLVLTIYFMSDLPRLRHGLVRLFPPERRARSGEIVELVFNKVGDYMIGNILISIVAGTAAYVALRLLGVPFALPLAILVAFFDLVPMVGATLGAIVCITVAALGVDVWPTGVATAAYFVVYQQVENYLIAPRILRTTVDVSASAVLLAGLIGATVLGLIGALIAIPVAAAIKVLYDQRQQAVEALAGPPPA
jgi:predicted PurR-regulated permease PerM